MAATAIGRPLNKHAYIQFGLKIYGRGCHSYSVSYDILCRAESRPNESDCPAYLYSWQSSHTHKIVVSLAGPLQKPSLIKFFPPRACVCVWSIVVIYSVRFHSVCIFFIFV